MTSTLLQMSALIACGAIWRYFSIGGLTAEQIRPSLTTLVYYLLLPAMVLEVLWQADIGLNSLQYTLLGLLSVIFAMLMIWCCGLILKFGDKQMGAVLLAAAFPNVTYLGLPVLEQTFGPWARSVAIQLDLFATMPFLLTVGAITAQHFGTEHAGKHRPIASSLNVPPLWAAIIAVIFNLNSIPMPALIEGILQKLSAGVVPLMLISLGLALNWRVVTFRNAPHVLPVIIIKMGLMPLFALWFARHLTLDDPHKAAAVLEMAMPSMVLGIVFCDRYQLDSSLYAMSVTVTTLLTLITLPFWHGILTG
ncbi:MAG: AEC family transporter [Gammaproteobacteria bacterium]